MLRYNGTINGGVLFTGNTLGLSKAPNQNEPGVLSAAGAFITTDLTQKVGAYPAGTTLDWTKNSSTAYLDLPPNTEVVYAELIWSGSVPNPGVLNTPVSLTLPDGTTHQVTPTFTPPIPGRLALYARSAEVTTLVQAGRGGMYIAGGIPGTARAVNAGSNLDSAGWTLAVVYKDGLAATFNITLFVGSELSYDGTPVLVSGFCVPSSGILEGYLYASAVEADPEVRPKYMLFGPNSNLTQADAIFGHNNPINTFFCSQINTLFTNEDDSARLDQRGSFGNYNANAQTGTLVPGGRQGYDITGVSIGDKLSYGQTQAYTLSTAQADGYLINGLSLVIKIGSPLISGAKAINTYRTTPAQLGDILVFSNTLSNQGTADAFDVVFKDPLPTGLTFIPGTVIVNSVSEPSFDPISGIALGDMHIGSSFTIDYEVRVDSYPNLGSLFSSISKIDYEFEPCNSGNPIVLTATTNEVQVELPDDPPSLVTTASINGETSIGAAVGEKPVVFVKEKNPGTNAALNVTISVHLPSGTSLVPDSITVNQVSIPDTDLGRGVPIGNIPGGGQGELGFQISVDSFPPDNEGIYVIEGGTDYQYLNTAGNFVPLERQEFSLTINLNAPPGAFSGSIDVCRALNKDVYCLSTNWTPPMGSQPLYYRIYNGEEVVATINALSPLFYKACLSSRGSTRTAQGYQISAVYPNDIESTLVPLVLRQ